MPKAREIGRRSSLEILETGAKELGLPPGTSGTHKRALRSRGLFSRHSRKMHREESKLEEEQEDQAEADASPRSLDGCSGDGEERQIHGLTGCHGGWTGVGVEGGRPWGW